MIDLAQKKIAEKYKAGHKDVRIESRKKRTFKLLKKAGVNSETTILDLGPKNMMAQFVMNEFKCQVDNTGEIDLNKYFIDLNRYFISPTNYDLITSFEVFEHLYNLFPLLQELRELDIAIVGSVPLRAWFAKQYWTDDYLDRHYNEFEPRQFNWIMEEAGFKQRHLENWYIDWNLSGIRPFLRSFLIPTWMGFIYE